MKNKFFPMALLAMGLATAANAQNNANPITESTTTASAQIVVPISISKGEDLNFGSIVRSVAGGTVTLSPTGTMITTNGVTMFGGFGTVNASLAEYTISGEVGKAYMITLPANNAVVLSDGAGHTMNLTDFAHNASGTFAEGTETFKVGATLNVGANQAAGNYVSEAFEVTVAYN